MKYGSVCSGIEAAAVAWETLGFIPVCFSEIEPFPCAVLNHHWPNVPNRGDITQFKDWKYEQIDILVGGTPCQSFNVAGLRKGLQDPRGNLMLTFLAIAEQYQPEWIVWENVPGVLSSNKGKDFSTFLGALAQLGYGFAYRILDAQYFGVPQRRRRVFVVANLRDWRRAATVLFEPESLCGHFTESRDQKQEIARTVKTRTGFGHDTTRDTYIVVNGRQNPPVNQKVLNGDFFLTGNQSSQSIARCLTTSCGTKLDFETDTFVLNSNIINKTANSGGNGMGVIHDDTCYTLTRNDRHAISQCFNLRKKCPTCQCSTATFT